MWEINKKPLNIGNDGTHSVLGTGAKVGTIVGMQKLKTDIAACLSLNENDANTATIVEYAQKAGEYRGFNSNLQRASKQKLNVAREILGTARTLLNHAQQSARTELTWQQASAQFGQNISGTMIELQTVQADHEGYVSHVAEANDLINW